MVLTRWHGVPKLVLWFLLTLVVTVVLCMFVLTVEHGGGLNGISPSDYFARRFVCLAAVLGLAMYGFVFHFEKFNKLLFKYRWLIALGVLLFCVTLEISGSSFGILLSSLGIEDNGLVFGTSRPIRSDEFAINTTQAFSQCQSVGAGSFQYFQDVTRATMTDMFIVYGQPVVDPAVVFRPFHWGYLLLGAAKGLSFFWYGRLIFLFMVSLEFAYRILVNRSRALAVAYAFLVAFSAQVQWWFAVNGLVEMLSFGQLALLLAHLYLNTLNYWLRIVYMLGIAWSLGVFVLTFYPAWQVPFAYVFVALLVALLVKELSSAQKNWKDTLIVIAGFLILVLAVGYVFWKSRDTIVTVMNTAYPGKRISQGGGYAELLFSYPVSVVTSLIPDIAYPNACEVAMFFSGFPLCLILPVYLMIKHRKADALFISLLVVVIALLMYVCVGIPEIVAKLSLFGRTTPLRAFSACSFAMLILLFSSLSRGGVRVGNWVALVLATVTTSIVVLGCIVSGMAAITFGIVAIMLVVVFVFLYFCFVSWTREGRFGFCCACLGVSVLCGALVNPVVVGVGELDDIEPLQAIKEANTEEDIWVSVDPSHLLGNVPVMVGAKTLNCVNVYPALDMWQKLDPLGQYEEVYNRYAHILVELADAEAPRFELVQGDTFKVVLSADDLASLGVTKIISSNLNLENNSTVGTQITLEVLSGLVGIYEVENRDGAQT